MDKLPLEIILEEIILYLDLVDLLNWSCCNRSYYNKLFDNPQFWRTLFLAEHQAPENASNRSWKELYMNYANVYFYSANTGNEFKRVSNIKVKMASGRYLLDTTGYNVISVLDSERFPYRSLIGNIKHPLRSINFQDFLGIIACIDADNRGWLSSKINGGNMIPINHHRGIVFICAGNLKKWPKYAMIDDNSDVYLETTLVAGIKATMVTITKYTIGILATDGTVYFSPHSNPINMLALPNITAKYVCGNYRIDTVAIIDVNNDLYIRSGPDYETVKIWSGCKHVSVAGKKSMAVIDMDNRVYISDGAGELTLIPGIIAEKVECFDDGVMAISP